MSSDIAIKVENLSKCYELYDTPLDRLKQFVFPSLQRAIGLAPRKYFREFWALSNVSFEINKGETVGIIGQNGSGKSTLLQMICGTLNPTRGSIQTNGRIAALLELGSGFNPEFTGRENVYLNGAVLGLGKEEIESRFDQIVAFADIAQFIEQPVKTYSSGMLVRLAFAIQANIDPDILIIDEALSVGDARFVHRCMLRFHQLKERGTTILFVSHDASAVKRLCGSALRFEKGSLVDFADSNSVVDNYLGSLFGGVKLEEATKLKASESIFPVEAQELDKCSVGDLREGDQSLEFISLELLSINNTRINSLTWGQRFKIKLLIINNSVERNEFISVGYIVRDPRGIEIASTSTVFEGVEITAPEIGEEFGITFVVTLPMLSPGGYTITPSVSVVTLGAEFSIRDRITNAILFSIEASAPIFTPLRFPTEVSLS